MIKFIALKEFKHIIRDPRSLIMIIFFPIIMLLLYGYAVNMDVNKLPIALLNFNNCEYSRELIRHLENSGKFQITYILNNIEEINKLLKRGKVLAVLIIPYNFKEKLIKDNTLYCQLTVDGSDSNIATLLSNYFERTAQFCLKLWFPESFDNIKISILPLYNPELKSRYFFVPGLIAVFMMMISALLSSITIVKEKEAGSLYYILITKVKPYQLILGKLLPYSFLSIILTNIILAVACLWFKVPFRGSYLLFIILTICYIYTASSLGLFVSVSVKKQEGAMLMAFVSTILPSIMLSGFIFPISSMPKILQLISNIVPAKYYLTIIRGIMLKNANFSILYKDTLFLIAVGTIIYIIATLRFYKQIKFFI